MALLVQTVDPRELARLRAIADRFELGRHDPMIVHTLAAIDPEHPVYGDVTALQVVRDRLRVYVEFHREHPFRVMPPEATHGSFMLAVQHANGTPVRRTNEHFAQHVGIFGATGFGKTTLLASLLPQLLAAGVHLIIVDRKDDTRALAAHDERFLILHPDVALNIIQQPPGITRPEHISTIVTCLARTFYGGEHNKQVLTDAHHQAFAQHEQPSLADVMAILRRMSAKGDTFSRRDAITGASLRLQRFAALYPGMFHTRAGLTVDDLFTHSLYFPITAANEASEFAITFLIHELLFHQRRQQRRGGLSYVVVLDEGLSAWNAQASNIDRQPLLSYVQSMVREYGIGMIVTSTSVQLLDPLLKANLGTQIVMNLTSAAESSEIARTFGLTSEEHEFLNTRLVRGECIIKLADEWRHPILATFPRSTNEKAVSPSDWQIALRRTDQLAALRALAAREGIEGKGQPTPSHEPAPSSAPPARVAPAVEQPRNTKTIALNKHATAILNDAAEHPYTLTTPCFSRCGLRLSEGERAKTTVMSLGFLESHRVRTGAGRGKTGNALRLTPAGHAWLGKRPPKGTRGGDSVQHAFLIHELSRRIPRSTIETLSVDLVVAYNTTTHKQLLNAIAQLSERQIALNDGDVIALEVECSRPELTGPRNVARNEGFALTIIATLGQAEALQQTIGATDRVVLLDVLRLLDALRS
ncbi:MAG: ATP-binding protein [Acidobacteria bacterium]|nr:ATP-binding protein [Acidobacteriota bacterium]MBV9475042.1 ATP-binding protein [Acidobacteriota bacterium]